VPRVYVTSRGRSGVSCGCLGSLVIGFIYLMAPVVFIGVLVVVGGIFLAALIVSLLALGVHRLMMAVSPSYQARRAVQGPFRPPSTVIEMTAKMIDSTKPRRRTWRNSAIPPTHPLRQQPQPLRTWLVATVISPQSFPAWQHPPDAVQ